MAVGCCLLCTLINALGKDCKECNLDTPGALYDAFVVVCWLCVSLPQKLELLPSPLDALIDALGGAQEVAEMTGRRGRLVRNSRSGRFKYELRPETEETR